VSLKFAESLKVVQNYTDEYGACKVLLVIYCRPKYVSLVSLRHIQRRIQS